MRKFSAFGASKFSGNRPVHYDKQLEILLSPNDQLKLTLKHFVLGRKSFDSFQFVIITNKGCASVFPDSVFTTDNETTVIFEVDLPILKELWLLGLAIVDGNGRVVKKETKSILVLPEDSFVFKYTLGVKLE